MSNPATAPPKQNAVTAIISAVKKQSGIDQESSFSVCLLLPGVGHSLPSGRSNGRHKIMVRDQEFLPIRPWPNVRRDASAAGMPFLETASSLLLLKDIKTLRTTENLLILGITLKWRECFDSARQKEATRSDNVRQARTSNLQPLYLKLEGLSRASLLCSAFLLSV